MSSIPAVKTTTRPTSAGRNFVALSFLVSGQYFGTLGLDHVSFTQWIHIVEWIVPFVTRIADWSVQKARTEAVRCGKKIQFDGFYLTRGHYRSGATFHDAKTGKIILRTLSTNKQCLGTRPLEIPSLLPVAKKVLFSSRDNCNYLILKRFERTSYFLGIQAWVLRQNGKQKKYAQKSGQRSTFSFLVSLFFIISQNACLNFFETAFELLLYRKYGKKV